MSLYYDETYRSQNAKRALEMKALRKLRNTNLVLPLDEAQLLLKQYWDLCLKMANLCGRTGEKFDTPQTLMDLANEVGRLERINND